MKIGITSDHGGFKLKQKLISYYKNIYEVIDYGTNNEELVDFPDYAFILGENISNKNIDFGIAICTTGIGMSIALNKVKGVICAKVDNVNDSIYAGRHNGANAIAIGGFNSFSKAKKMIDTFLKQNLDSEERYKLRIEKIRKYENEH
jgi:ribose 5-phosphate isomerase B